MGIRSSNRMSKEEKFLRIACVSLSISGRNPPLQHGGIVKSAHASTRYCQGHEQSHTLDAPGLLPKETLWEDDAREHSLFCRQVPTLNLAEILVGGYSKIINGKWSMLSNSLSEQRW